MHEYYWENYTEMDQYGYEDYDNDLSYMLVNSDDNTVDTLNLPAGEYFYKILYNRIQVASIPVAVVEPEQRKMKTVHIRR